MHAPNAKRSQWPPANLYLAQGAGSSMAGYASASKQQPVLLVVDSVKFNLTH